MPSILVLSTGGTIDKVYFDDLSEYRVGKSVVERLLSVARVEYPYRVHGALRKDSLDLTDQDRAALLELALTEPETHIVITHGTDTMTQTAAVLEQVTDKTIVLTGALAPARFTESDAAFNLGMAFVTAQTAPPGVYITMNGEVFKARDVVKDRARGRFVSRHRDLSR